MKQVKDMNPSELMKLDPKLVKEPAELSAYSLRVFRLRQQFERNAAAFKKKEAEAADVADSGFLAGLDKVEAEYGTYKRAEATYMVLPEDGWSPVFDKIASDIKNNVPAEEALGILSHYRLRTTAFEDMNLDELPAGISRDKKKSVKFTAKRNVTI